MLMYRRLYSRVGIKEAIIKYLVASKMKKLLTKSGLVISPLHFQYSIAFSFVINQLLNLFQKIY